MLQWGGGAWEEGVGGAAVGRLDHPERAPNNSSGSVARLSPSKVIGVKDAHVQVLAEVLSS